MRCCDKPRHAAICDYMDACVAAIRARFAPVFSAANVEHPLAHITIKLSPERRLAWTPGFGWRIEHMHPATGTPAGKALYLAAGPFPPPATVADRLTAWTGGALALTEMQPHHRVTEAALVLLLRDAVSGRPVEYRCPHCKEWETADDPGDENAYCVTCGTHLPLREAMRRFLEAFSGNSEDTALERRLADAEAANAQLVKQIGDVLESARWALSTSSEDWGATFDKAWLYGLFVGWDCEEDHDHDEICGGTGALAALANRGFWPGAAVVKLRSLRSIVRALEDMEAEQ